MNESTVLQLVASVLEGDDKAARRLALSLASDLPQSDWQDRPLASQMGIYRQLLPSLFAEGHEGRFIVIMGDEVLGTFYTLREALLAGYTKDLHTPFLAKKIQSEEKPVFCSREIKP